MKHFLIFLLIGTGHFSFAQDFILNEYRQTSSSNNSIDSYSYGIKGVLSGTTVNANAKAIIAQNNGTSILGIGATGEHKAGGYGLYALSSGGIGLYASTNTGTGVYATSVSSNGIRATSGSLLSFGALINASGSTAIDASGQPVFLLNNSTAALDKVLISDDNTGTVRWDEYILYTTPATATNSRDTTIEGNNMKILNLSVPCLTQSVVDKGEILVYMIIPGDPTTFPLPYSSNAGGKANTMSFIPQVDKKRILITRFAHDNSGSVGISSSLNYRVVIMPKKSVYGQ